MIHFYVVYIYNILVFQSTMNMLFSGKSISDQGTLSQLRDYFLHRNVTTDVMNSFNHVENFMRFTTEAHIVYLFMHLLNMSDICDVPPGSNPHGTKAQREGYLNNICNMITDEIWLLPSMSDVYSMLESEADEGSNNIQPKFCICKEGIYH